MAEQDPERFDRAAARWHARLVLETSGMGIAESQLALGVVADFEPRGRPLSEKSRETQRTPATNISKPRSDILAVCGGPTQGPSRPTPHKRRACLVT